LSKQKKILLVEDEPFIAVAQAEKVSHFGYDVVTASTGENAVDLVKKDQDISLILMDIDLGSGIDGTEAATQILSFIHVPIIFLTSHSEKSFVEKVKKITRYGYVLKTSSSFVLESSIEMAYELFAAHRSVIERNQQLFTTLHSIGDAVISTDLQCKVIQLNPIAEKLTGWSNDEAAGKKLSEVFNIVNSKTGKKVDDPAKKVLASGAIVGLANHTVLISKDGTRYQISDSAAPIRENKNGKILGVVLVFRDVTDEYVLRQKVEDREYRFNSLFEHMREGVALHKIVYDKKGKPVNYLIADTNDRYEQILNIKKSDIVNKLATEAYGTEEAPYLKEYSDVVLKQKGAYIETYFPPMDKYFSISIAPWGKDGFATIFTDVTEQKKHTELIEQEKKFSQRIMNISPDLIYLYDIQKGRNVYINDGIEKMLGYTPNQIQKFGDTVIKNLMHPDDFKIYLKETLPAYEKLKDSDHIKHSFRMKNKSGEWCRLEAHELIYSRDDNGKPVQILGIIRDITKQYSDTEKIKLLLSEKTAILKEVHHRIKNNMQTIRSLLKLHALSVKNEETKYSLQDAISRVQSMETLYEHLYDSDNYREMPADIYFDSLINEIINIFTPACNVSVKKKIQNILLSPKVLFPLGIILNEIITNTMKYAFSDRKKGILKITLEKKGKKALLKVSDDGAGFDKEKLHSGFGFKLINLLTEQIQGTFEVSSDNGTDCLVAFVPKIL
jgi:PAS domain S-box-containing protein